MTQENEPLSATINELIDTFRSGLLALLPIADRSKLTWADANQHRHWESLAESVFDAFVRGPVATNVELEPSGWSLARYDVDVTSYQGHCWIGVVMPHDHRDCALVRLLSVDAPFDTVQLVGIDPETGRAESRSTVAYAEASFYLARRTGAKGAVDRIYSVVADD